MIMTHCCAPLKFHTFLISALAVQGAAQQVSSANEGEVQVSCDNSSDSVQIVEAPAVAVEADGADYAARDDADADDACAAGPGSTASASSPAGTVTVSNVLVHAQAGAEAEVDPLTGADILGVADFTLGAPPGPPYECSECQQLRFPTVEKLQDHVDTQHLKAVPISRLVQLFEKMWDAWEERTRNSSAPSSAQVTGSGSSSALLL